MDQNEFGIPTIQLGNGTIRVADIYWNDGALAGVCFAPADQLDTGIKTGDTRDVQAVGVLLQVVADNPDSLQVLIDKLTAAKARMTSVEAGSALALVAAERQRQITAEGYTAQHDDNHGAGELAAAAACFSLNAGVSLQCNPNHHPEHPYQFWPWTVEHWKPRAPIEDLVRAGALILAEIERIQRAERDS